MYILTNKVKQAVTMPQEDLLSEIEKDGELHTVYGYDAFGKRVYEQGKKGESLYTYNAPNQLVSRRDMLEEEENRTQTYLWDGKVAGKVISAGTCMWDNIQISNSVNYDCMLEGTIERSKRIF